MPITLTGLLAGLAAPAATSLVVFAAVSRIGAAGQRWAPCLALVCGFVLGGFALGLHGLAPDSHWQWLPYAAAFTLAAGPIAQAPGVTHLERSALYAFAALVCGWLLTPTWDALSPTRATHVAVWTAGVAGLALALDPLVARVSGRTAALLFASALLTTAIVQAVAGSLRFAEFAVSGAAAAGGLVLIASRTTNALRGAALAYTVIAAGVSLVGRVNSFSDVPLAGHALPPLAPALGWIGLAACPANVQGWRRAACTLAAPLLACLVAVAWSLAAERAWLAVE